MEKKPQVNGQELRASDLLPPPPPKPIRARGNSPIDQVKLRAQAGRLPMSPRRPRSRLSQVESQLFSAPASRPARAAVHPLPAQAPEALPAQE